MIEEQLYRQELLEIVRNPVNRGEIKNPDLEAVLENPLCGDEVRLQIKLDKDRIKRAVFSGNGCAISQASASLLAQTIEGKRLGQVKNLKTSDILKLIGIKPNPTRMGCALLSLETLREALLNSAKS